MTDDMVIAIGSEAIKTTIYLAGPMLLATLIVGLIVSIFQAVTQINEATLTFIPKMLAVVAVLAVMSPWMLQILNQYATVILGGAHDWIR